MFPKKAPSGSSLPVVPLLLLLCGAWLPAVPAMAQQAGARTHSLKPSVVLKQEYDTNVFQDEKRERSSWLTHARPTLAYVYRGDRLRSRLEAGIQSRKVWSYNSENAIDRFAKWDLEWQAAQYLALRSEGRITELESRDESTTGTEILRQGRPDQDILEAGVGADYTLGARTRLTFDLNHRDSRYEDSARFLEDETPLEGNPIDRRTNSAALALTRAVTASDNVTTTLRAQFSEFDNDDVKAIPRTIDSNDELVRDSDSDIFGATVGWRRVWGPNWTTNIYAGGRLLRSEVEREDVFSIYTASFLDPDVVTFTDNASAGTATHSSERGYGFIGGVALTRTLPRGSIEVGWSRETRPSGSSISSSVDTDNFTAAWLHRLSDRLKFTANARLRLNESASEFDLRAPLGDRGMIDTAGLDFLLDQGCTAPQIPTTISLAITCPVSGRSEVDTRDIDLFARLDWEVRRQLNAHVIVRFADRDSDGTRNLPEFDRLRVLFGFRYNFDLGL